MKDRDRICWRDEAKRQARMITTMSTGKTEDKGAAGDLPPAARRALAEAEARRAAIDARSAGRPKELKGADGPEPTRYGDWEKKGLASDF